MVTDSIADLLTRIRNAILAHHQEVSIPTSKVKEAVAKTLKDGGYIQDYQVKGRQLMVRIKYREGKPAIENLRRVSKPGRRVYCPVDKIPWVRNGFGMAIISTPKGVMTDVQARKHNLGGEIICEVW